MGDFSPTPEENALQFEREASFVAAIYRELANAERAHPENPEKPQPDPFPDHVADVVRARRHSHRIAHLR